MNIFIRRIEKCLRCAYSAASLLACPTVQHLDVTKPQRTKHRQLEIYDFPGKQTKRLMDAGLNGWHLTNFLLQDLQACMQKNEDAFASVLLLTVSKCLVAAFAMLDCENSNTG